MVNYLAVLVAAIVGMVVGFIWYSPKVFGKMWMKLSGVNPKDKPDKINMVWAFISQLVMAYVLALFVQAGNLNASLQTSLLIWLGFIGTITLGSVLWQGKSWKLWFLNNAHNVVSIMVMAAIIAVWP